MKFISHLEQHYEWMFFTFNLFDYLVFHNYLVFVIIYGNLLFIIAFIIASFYFVIVVIG